MNDRVMLVLTKEQVDAIERAVKFGDEDARDQVQPLEAMIDSGGMTCDDCKWYRWTESNYGHNPFKTCSRLNDSYEEPLDIRPDFGCIMWEAKE